MLQQLLGVELLLKLSGGIVLALFPVAAARALGLPHGQVGLWPRLLGAVLIGLSGAIYVEGNATGARGIGIAGLVLVNLTVVAMVVAVLALRPPESWRGRTALALLAIGLFVLTLFEIAVL